MFHLNHSLAVRVGWYFCLLVGSMFCCFSFGAAIVTDAGAFWFRDGIELAFMLLCRGYMIIRIRGPAWRSENFVPVWEFVPGNTFVNH